jgi:hypothetical protein
MTKSTRKKAKEMTTLMKKAKKTKKTAKGRTETAEYVSCLLELHKLQGVLLNQLEKAV